MSSITFEAYASQLKSHSSYHSIRDGSPLTTFFESAYQHPKWSDAIDRKYNALLNRNTWTNIKKTEEMKPFSFKRTFRAKQPDREGKRFLCKDRCVIRDDKQQ